MSPWQKVERNIQKLPLDVNVFMKFNDGTYAVGRFTTIEIGDHRFLTVDSNKSDDYDIVWPNYWMSIPEIVE